MKKYIYILIVLLSVSCMDMNENPYSGSLHTLTVTSLLPEEYADFDLSGCDVLVEDMNTGNRYMGRTDVKGGFSMTVPNGIYRINISGRFDMDVFNGAVEKISVSGADVNLSLNLLYSKAGSIIIKELYCGGCKKLPEEGDYQGDQYFILHNNDYQVQYLDSLCFGTLAPYNSTGQNPWQPIPDFLPVIQAVWQFPGDGDDYPLYPGEDAVVCLRGAIDHTAQYPLSVNLNKAGYFVCYNITYFPNTAFHPAPGDQIKDDHILNVVIKTGKANAYSMSLSSPTLVIWKAEGMTMHEFANMTDNVIPVPGSTVDNVVKVPYEWIYDAVEVFDARSTTNTKRLAASADAGYVMQTDTYLGRSLMRRVDEKATAASGYEVLVDTNNSLNDFYETEKQSLHE